MRTKSYLATRSQVDALAEALQAYRRQIAPHLASSTLTPEHVSTLVSLSSELRAALDAYRIARGRPLPGRAPAAKPPGRSKPPPAGGRPTRAAALAPPVAIDEPIDSEPELGG